MVRFPYIIRQKGDFCKKEKVEMVDCEKEKLNAERRICLPKAKLRTGILPARPGV